MCTVAAAPARRPNPQSQKPGDGAIACVTVVLMHRYAQLAQPRKSEFFETLIVVFAVAVVIVSVGNRAGGRQIQHKEFNHNSNFSAAHHCSLSRSWLVTQRQSKGVA